MTSTLIDEMIAAAEAVKPLGHVSEQEAAVFLAFYRAIQAHDARQSVRDAVGEPPKQENPSPYSHPWENLVR